MDILDNLDRQILGYIHRHPHAMYGEIAHELGCQKMIVARRIQNLFNLGFVKTNDLFELVLSAKATAVCSYVHEQEFNDGEYEFDWSQLYIPLNFQ